MHPNFVRERLLLAAQGGVQAALKEEGGAHTLLRGVENIAEGFKVDRANLSSSTSLIFALLAKIFFFLCERTHRSIQQDLQGNVFMINPSLMIGNH